MRCQNGNKYSVVTCARDILANNLAVFFLYLENLSKTDFHSNKQICFVETVPWQLSIQVVEWLQLLLSSSSRIVGSPGQTHH